MQDPFVGKYAIVTGAAGGMSKEGAFEMARRGLSGCIIADIQAGKAAEAAREIQAATGCTCYPFQIDLAEVEQIEALFAFALQKFPTIHILVNGAGVFPQIPINQLTPEQWDQCLNINLRGLHFCTREALKIMRPQKYGKIINLASLVASLGTDTAAVCYAASKAGVIGATKSYALLASVDNVNVNAINPGFIATPMTANIPTSPEMARAIGIRLGRIGQPEDVARVICFLASEDSSYMVGCTLEVNGGIFMG